MHSYFIVSAVVLFVFISNFFTHLQDYILSNNILAVAYYCVILVILIILIIHAIAFYEY